MLIPFQWIGLFATATVFAVIGTTNDSPRPKLTLA